MKDRTKQVDGNALKNSNNSVGDNHIPRCESGDVKMPGNRYITDCPKCGIEVTIPLVLADAVEESKRIRYQKPLQEKLERLVRIRKDEQDIETKRWEVGLTSDIAFACRLLLILRDLISAVEQQLKVKKKKLSEHVKTAGIPNLADFEEYRYDPEASDPELSRERHEQVVRLDNLFRILAELCLEC